MEKRIWLITGISSGIGKALSDAVMESGDYIVGTLRSHEGVDQFNKQHVGKGEAHKIDVTDYSAISALVKNIISKHNRIDVLVNNAGVGFIGAIEETSLSEVRHVFEPNFFAALRLTQEVLPFMRAQKSGRIIQVSSHGGIKAFGGFGIYNASKFALEGFSEALAQEVAPLGIKVSIVEPGPFRTRFASSSLREAERVIDDYQETAGAFRAKLKGVDGQQEGDPEKAAEAIIHLSQEEEPTLRLPLGKTALLTIGMKIESVKNDLEHHKVTAEQAIF